MRIERLTKEDYQECMDFINMVFSMSSGPTDFLQLLPAYYEETEASMQCHYVLRERGRIKALVGLYPGTMVVGREKLRLARIGAVSTHPYSQGRGYMQTLMKHCMDIVHSDFDVSHLGGLRLRYLYFGYEKCGIVPVFSLNRHNLRHSPLAAEITVSEITEAEPTVLETLQALHDEQPIHGQRNPVDFYRICRNWSNRLFTAHMGDELVGYAVAGDKLDRLSEVIGRRSEQALAIAQAMLQYSGGSSLDAALNPTATEDIRLFGTAAEDVRLDHGGNWRISSWSKVLAALFKVKNQQLPLPDGEVVLDIADTVRLCIRVADGNVSVSETKAAAHVTGSASQMMRLLFGPLPPTWVNSVPSQAGVLQAWLPLPLYLPQQDHA